MRHPSRDRIMALTQAVINALLQRDSGTRQQPAELHDTLAGMQNQLIAHGSLLQQLVERNGSRSLPVVPTMTPPFEISEDINKPPVIRGKIKPKLTVTQHDIVMELVKAGPGGLSMKDLDAKSDHTEARKTLKKLARDADWNSVIIFPEKKGQSGYRLCFS